ncbi:MAG: guanylate kinase [Bacteroidota bacterium]
MKIIVLTAPSGSGKTTIARALLAAEPGLRFSVSATTRPPRGQEQDGVEYFFLSDEAFRSRIADGAFLEYEEVYGGSFYGTLRQELERVAVDSRAALLDIDVKGALNVKRLYGDRALTLFIAPPSLAALAERLRARGTDADAAIATRLARAELEMGYAPEFDHTVVNDDLDTAVEETVALVRAFLAA